MEDDYYQGYEITLESDNFLFHWGGGGLFAGNIFIVDKFESSKTFYKSIIIY